MATKKRTAKEGAPRAGEEGRGVVTLAVALTREEEAELARLKRPGQSLAESVREAALSRAEALVREAAEAAAEEAGAAVFPVPFPGRRRRSPPSKDPALVQAEAEIVIANAELERLKLQEEVRMRAIEAGQLIPAAVFSEMSADLGGYLRRMVDRKIREVRGNPARASDLVERVFQEALPEMFEIMSRVEPSADFADFAATCAEHPKAVLAAG